MENCARQLTDGGSEEPIMSVTSPSATLEVTSNFHTAVEEWNLSSLDEVALGDRSGAGSSMEPKSEYFSARVEEMMRSKSQFSSPVEHEIEHSKVHWSEVRGLSASSRDNHCEGDPSEDNDSEEEDSSEESDSEAQDNNDYEEVDRENEKFFKELMNDPQWKQHEFGDFFLEWSPLWILGPKIAEGGQAEIREVIVLDGNVDSKFLVKVFKRGYCLSDLKKQWPCGILRREVACVATFGFLLEDKRFGFGMLKCWGDLRKLIDQAMKEKNNQGPPFPYEWSGVIWHAKHVMLRIAFHMEMLHRQGIIHRDLKAANILFHANDKVLNPETATITEMLRDRSIFVADFECSIGVVGTKFWKAPEILLALKNKVANTTIHFTEKADVYSYAMTCFEIVTGRLPFEGELEDTIASRDLVIEGRRPKLPSDLDVTLKDLIERCWNPIPSERPSFSEIYEVLAS